jgi:hypothetical protein
MTTVFQRLVLAAIFAVAGVPVAAVAQEGRPAPMEATLDIDHDGKMDRAVMVGDDLYIYLSASDENLGSSREPSFLKKDLATARVLAVESKPGRRPALVIKYGCGGCSNDFGTTLTIVYRGGQFIVAGVTYDWDTRGGIGSCDVNFLTGKGVATQGLGADKRTWRLEGRFTPVKLADWSQDKRPRACGIN